jgi:hypothetical protein
MTIAQQLKIKEFPFKIKDSKGNLIYFENPYGYWAKREYDSNGNEIYWESCNGAWEKIIYDSKGNSIYSEDSTGYWEKRKIDSKGNLIYSEDSDGFWAKREYDSEGKEIFYYEDSFGTIVDNRPKTDVQKALELLTKEGLIVDGKIVKN